MFFLGEKMEIVPIVGPLGSLPKEKEETVLVG